MSDDTEVVALAERVAVAAHVGQVDKAGKPYWTHPSRVAQRVRELYPDAPDAAVAAAWLHDVIEDTTVTEVELREQFITEVVDAVVALTRQDNVAPDEYYANIRSVGGIALIVKHADITDNLDEHRLALLGSERAALLRAKYTKARASLGLSD